MTALLLAWWLALPMIEVTGSTTCPMPAQVQERLSGLGLQADGGERHKAVLAGSDKRIHIALFGADGGVLAQRDLDKVGTCNELAEAVAVVLSTWEARIRPKLATPQVWPPERSPKEAATVAEATAERPKSMPFDAGIGLLASVAGGELALGAMVEGSLFPLDVPLALHLALWGTETRSLSIDEPRSTAKWWRMAMSLGPSFRLRRGPAGLDIHLGAILALLHVQGDGLLKNNADTTVQLGAEAGARGLWIWNNAAVWAGVTLLVYPGHEYLAVDGYDAVGELPRLEVQLALGLSLGRFL
jgi:hypothetical protein